MCIYDTRKDFLQEGSFSIMIEVREDHAVRIFFSDCMGEFVFLTFSGNIEKLFYIIPGTWMFSTDCNINYGRSSGIQC